MREGAKRDRVRDQRIAKVVELSPPEKLLEELPLGDERAQAVVTGARGSRRRPRTASDDRGCWSWSARAASTTRRRRSSTPAGWRRRPRSSSERPAGRDARLLREAADHDRLEGPDQRPAPRRLRRRQRRPADRPRAAARGARPGPAGRLRVPRPDHAAVHLRHGRLGRDRRAHHREPDPPPARLRPLDAGRLQEPHRRQRPGRGRRGPRRRGASTPSPASTTPARRRSCTPPATPTAT